MRVIATAPGYGGKNGQHQLREPGDEFEVEDDAAKASWYVPVEEKPAAKGKGKQGADGEFA
ncbi:hypothetical protein [Ralstonia mannitolilytica]|uniref:hypothetical protein n=1 Tax=Ralstonia mannitolilytica TaxID=105219 RepID=UPI0007B017BB|nr:hypothetical protein [Ralstonia mannitolilytica]ANA34302.1 hypothetical protein VZ52_13355 [Ralstonia mannitolilytica]